MGLSPEQRKARARDLCISEYGIDPEARITDNPELPPLPAADRIMWQHGQQIDHYSPVQMRAYAAEAVRVALERAAWIADMRAERQSLREIHEGNDYAAERAIEAKGCAAAIRALKPA